MTNGQIIQKFASDLCEALPIMVDTLNKSCEKLEKQANDINKLTEANKELSARQITFDDQKLFKAASAINKACGGLSAEQLYSVYRNQPNALLDSIYKVASDVVGYKVSSNLGTVRSIKKEASTEIRTNNREVDGRALFMDIYNKNK